MEGKVLIQEGAGDFNRDGCPALTAASCHLFCRSPVKPPHGFARIRGRRRMSSPNVYTEEGVGEFDYPDFTHRESFFGDR